MTWFDDLVGFREQSGDQVRSMIDVDGDRLQSRANGQEFRCGTLEVISLHDLRKRTTKTQGAGKLLGIQWDTQVTLGDCQHSVTQAYCSALPVAYSSQSSKLWEPFARLVLEAAYEATLHVALLNAERIGNRKAYLTLLGGGAFRNDSDWIMAAIERPARVFASVDEHHQKVWRVANVNSRPCLFPVDSNFLDH